MKLTIGNVARLGSSTAILLLMLTASSLVAFAHPQTDAAKQATAQLRHTPHGFANLQWKAHNKTLTVTVMLAGLQAQTRHPAHIHAGSCAIDGTIIYKLNDVVADNAGNGASTTTISNVTKGIPATGWHINVHSGPTLATPAEALPITCGSVIAPQPAANTDQAVKVILNGVNMANQSSSGTTSLTLTGTTLTVKTTVNGLVPGSSHAFHIHAGSCERQVPGTILYNLSPLKADGQGSATSTTIIPNVKDIPVAGWYLNVHFSADLGTQTGYDPIACGNVVTH